MNAYLSLPLIGSAFVEVREEWVGFGIEAHPRGDREFFLGRVHITHSPAQNGGSKKPVAIFLAVASITALIGTGAVTSGGLWVPRKQEAAANIPQCNTIPTLDISIQSE